jgi:hypothetical protein
MLKNTARRSRAKSTEWHIGQPLAFPPSRTEIERLAQEAVEDGASGPLKRKREKRKKK